MKSDSRFGDKGRKEKMAARLNPGNNRQASASLKAAIICLEIQKAAAEKHVGKLELKKKDSQSLTTKSVLSKTAYISNAMMT